MRFFVCHENEHLEVLEKDYEAFRQYAEQGYTIAWENKGLIGTLSNAKLRDMLRVWDCYLDLKARGRIVEVPAYIHSFIWEDTEEHRQL